MKHDEFQEQISRLVDNDLHEEESTSLFTHLADCHECREFMQSILRLRSGLAADSATPSAAIDNKLRQRFSSPAAAMSKSVQSLWNRHVTLHVPVVVLFLCLLATGAVLTVSGHVLFSEPETVYVTRLPAVVITDGSETVRPKN